MGCLSSKSGGPNEQAAHSAAENPGERRRAKTAKSVDSGISLSEGEKKQADSGNNESTQTKKTNGSAKSRKQKGVAFEIPANSESIIKTHPPKRFKSHLQISRNAQGELKPIRSSPKERERLRQIVQKQVQAEKLREQERHSVVARQKRREARARQVQARRKKLLEEAENWGDDEMSDIENDQNFNNVEEYDFFDEVDHSATQFRDKVDGNDHANDSHAAPGTDHDGYEDGF